MSPVAIPTLPTEAKREDAHSNLKAAVAKLLAERQLTGDGSVWVSRELRAELKRALEAS